MTKHSLILRHKWALGDTVLLSALVRDIHRAYPDQYEIGVDTNWTPVWYHNPYVTTFTETTNVQKITLSWGSAIPRHSYAQIGDAQVMRHILAWYHYDFTRQTGIPVPVTEPRGELYLTPEESRPIIEGRYWVMMAGGKLDMTNKLWDPARYQTVVDGLQDHGITVAQCGSAFFYDVHTPLRGTINMIGHTNNVRDFFNVIQHCEGVICPVTAAMHIAAVYQKPCVVLAGGREEPWFEAYTDGYRAFGLGCPPVITPHKFLHTLGLLDCCKTAGCWKHRTVAIEPVDLLNGKTRRELCLQPGKTADETPISGCMLKIQPEHVIQAVLDYQNPLAAAPSTSFMAPVGLPGNSGAQGAYNAGNKALEALAMAKSTSRRVTSELQPAPKLSIDANITLPRVVRSPSGAVSELRPDHLSPPREYTPAGVSRRNTDFDLLDNPIIGGRYTVCVLCYGEHADLAKRCLNSILTTVPRDRLDLRVATNAACPETVEFLHGLDLDMLYVNASNRMKYPVMRELFNDPEKPLLTPYLIWFDDDAYVIDPKWLVRLTETILANHRSGNRLYGMKMFHDLAMYAKNGHRPDRWFQAASWYRGRNFRVRGQDMEGPNGSCLDFVAGWFWACGTDAIRAAGIPDVRLHHNGGDCTIGEQIHQTGFKIKDFNRNKAFVCTPTREQGGRRGFSEQFPWSMP